MKTHRIARPRASQLSTALVAILALAIASGAQAQEQAQQQTERDDATELDVVEVQGVVVVGSRIKRAEIEGPAPVTVITRADIDREGFQTAGDMLQTLTQNTASNFTGDVATGNFTPNAQIVNLRNLGPGYTLVLVNGKRPAQYPQPYNRDNNVVNVKNIPSSVIERVEVLVGGASAIYGSDAVAGVVNFVLREHFEDNLLRATVGTTAEGGGDSVNIELTGGKSGDDWSMVYALQYGENEQVFNRQRDFLADRRNNPYGLAVGPSFAQASISGSSGRNLVYDQAFCDALGFTTTSSALRGPFCGPFDFESSRSLQNKNRFFNGYAYGTYDFNESLTGYARLNYYTTEATNSSGTEFWSTDGDLFTSDPSGAPTLYYYDAGLEDLVLLQRLFMPSELGGNRAANSYFDETSYDVSAGLQGMFGERFDWELGAAYGRYRFERDRPRLLAKAVHDYYLGPLQGYISGYPIFTLDIDRWNAPITPEIYGSFSTRVPYASQATSASADFTITGDLFDLPAGPVGFAGAIEATRQTSDIISDWRTDQLRPIDEHTIFNLTTSGDTHGERDRYAVAAEFRVPIFESLSLQAAARYDKYDDITAVDDATTYNLGLEWRPFRNLLLRGSYATSFRAPDMQLVFAQGAASYAAIIDAWACRSGMGLGQTPGTPGRTIAECAVDDADVTSYQTRTLVAGNPLLKEEEGKSLTYGLVWDIVDNMSLTVDYWRVRLQDAATSLNLLDMLANEANCRIGTRPDGTPFEHGIDSAYCQNILELISRVDAPGTAFDQVIDRINTAYINAAMTDMSGIDASYRYRLDTNRMGSFTLDLAYSVLLTNKYQENEEDTLTDYRDLPLFDYSQRSRARGSIGWKRGDWNATVFGLRYGSNWNNGWTRRLPPYMIYNLQVGKQFGSNVRVDFTVNNVLNNQFRHDPTRTTYPYFNPYIGSDPLGRRFYLSTQYRF